MTPEPTIVRRCIALPVQHSVDITRGTKTIAARIEQKELWETLGACWEQSTALANWCVQRCAKQDIVRTPGVAKCPAFPAWPVSGPSVHASRQHRGLYGCAIHELGAGRPGDYWCGAMNSVSSICRKVEGKYRQSRFAVVWKRDTAPVLFRYPYPFPVHAQSWSPLWVDDHPVVDLALPGAHLGLQLRTGPEFGRQIGAFRQLVAGKIKQSELSITRQACHSSHRPQMVTKGVQRESWRVMVRIMTEQTVEYRDSDKVLTVRTDPNALWVAELDGRQAWVLNADHVKRAIDWQEHHAAKRQRWAQDCKAERRADPHKLAQFEHARVKVCDKHARRMSSWLHETAAHLVRFAVRQRVGVVAYLDEHRGFMPALPWHRLRGLLVEKLEAAGIRYIGHDASAEAVNEEIVEEVEQVEAEVKVATKRKAKASRKA